MKVKDMSIGELTSWTQRVEELQESGKLTKQAWCDIGHELMKQHDLSQRVAVMILHGRYQDAMDIEEGET